VTLLIVYISFALSISFLCSLSEAVILSVSHTYIGLLVKDGRRSGRMLRAMKKNIEHPLAVILTLNTVANTIGAAGVGAQIYHLFGSKWVAIGSASLTVAILVFSEIIPKTLGTAHWKKIAPVAVYFLHVFIVALYPIVKILEAIAGLFSGEENHSHITREEMIVLAEMGERDGVLTAKEARIIENLLLFSEVHAREILTPRAVILALQKDTTISRAVTEHSPLRFSRIPVYGEEIDDILGHILKEDILSKYYAGEGDETIEHLIKPLHAVPETKSLAGLFDEFISRREHMFLVIDEYGGTEGIVTLEDVIETLLGVEIIDELDSVEDMRAFALEKWKSRRRGKFMGF